MKKKIILTIVLTLLLVGCTNPINNMIDETKSKINKEVSKVENIGKDKIKEHVTYILEHYNSKVDKDYVYNVMILKELTKNSYFEDNNIKLLSDRAYNYMLIKSKTNKNDLETIVEIVKKDTDKEVDEFYNLYKQRVVINSFFAKAKTKLLNESKSKDYINKNKIKEAIKYIKSNYKNSYKNNEIMEHICYYSYYLDNINTKYKVKNNITELGNKTKNYLLNNNKKVLKDIEDIINKIEEGKEIEEILNSIK